MTASVLPLATALVLLTMASVQMVTMVLLPMDSVVMALAATASSLELVVQQPGADAEIA